MPVRVLIVDDSALVRRALTEGLSADPDIEVVGSAIDPYVARDKILQLQPDVLTLDIEMPRMDGLTFLKVLMKHHPMPVIVMSSLTTAGSTYALEALQAGAVDVVAKPGNANCVAEETALLAEKIKAVARARVRHTSTPASASAPTPASPKSPGRKPPSGGRRYAAHALILIGASTGGTKAIETVLTALPKDLPGILIVQHIPAQFSLAFANRLNELCRLEVREAKNGDVLQPGLALVAPGGFHMIPRWNSTHYAVTTTIGPPVHHQRPSVDVLFDSAARAGSGPYTLAALLTGMGADGAAGMLALRRAGATTFAQNEETCVVFGMPKEAIQLGAAQRVLPLEHIAAGIDRFADSISLIRT